MKFHVNVDLRDVERGLSDLERKQFPFAAALALNDTGADMLEATVREIDRAFDRPTRFTRNAFYLWRANKKTLSATIERKTMQRGRHYLEVQTDGGVRPATGLEKLLTSRLKYAGVIQSVVPAKGAKRNAYGNWSPGQRNQVLSAIQAQRDLTANTTAASVKRNARRSGYFVPRPGSKLSPGVYERTGRGAIRKVLHFSAWQASYRKRFKLYEVTEDAAASAFVGHFRKRLAEAVASAR